MSWKDLNNDLSDPSFSRMTFPNAPDSIISKFMAKGIFNFFPFKVVNLKWLIDIGKATQAPKGEGYQTTNCGVYHFYAMTFNKDDKYLPVGDVVINMDKSPENGRWCNGNSNPVLDLTKVFILLVKNDSKYSTIIKDSDWKFVSRSRDCNTPITWAFRAVVNNNRNYNTDYNVIGDSFKNWNHGDGWWPDGNSCLLPNNPFDRKERPIAAVHTNFLSVNKSKSKQDTDVKSFELNGDFGCRYRHFLSATSPFNTFNVSADEDTRGGGRNVDDGYWGDWPAPNGPPTYWPKYKFYDIIPEFFTSECCAGTLPANSEMWQCGRYSDSSSSTCKLKMDDFCIGDNLTKNSCKIYCKGKDCDDRLSEFCGAGSYAEQKGKYEKNPEICSCFMPRSFYEAKDTEYYSKMGAAGQKLVDLLKASGVYGGNPECSDLQCKFGGTTLQHSTFKQGSCPSINIQNCINEQATTNKGTLKAGTIDQSQANNCVQQSQTVNNTTQPPQPHVVQPPPPQQTYTPPPPQQTYTPPPPQQQEETKGSNKMIIYGAIAFVVLLLIILLIVLMM